jgi:amino acid transporter
VTRRRLTLLDVLAIGVNAIVGSGVFAMPDDMLRAMGAFSPLAYVGCALVLIPVSLCFAELASSESETGGPYLYARQAFGARVGLLVGWACYLNAFLSFAANVTQFVALAGLREHFAYRPVVVGTILLLGAINYVGVRPGATLVGLMTFGKLAAIGLFVVSALLHFDGARFSGQPELTTAGVANGVYLALFPLQGFEVVPVPAGETKNPERSIPIATVGSLVFATLLFVTVQAVMIGAYSRLAAESDTPLVDAARTFGPLIGLLVFLGSIVSVGGFSAGSALGSPRYAQALATGGDLPSRLAALHPRFNTPHLAIAATTLLTALLGAFFTYRELVGFSNVTVVFQYALTCLAVPILRRRGRTARFRVPLGWTLPLVGTLGSIALLYGSSVTELIWAAAGLGAGVAVTALVRSIERRPPPVGT